MISILIVDDQPLVRAAINRLLSEIPTVKVFAEAGSGEEALRLVREKRPNLVFMDLYMPGMSGLAAIPKILHYVPKTKIIAVSSYTQEPFPSRALEAGVKGYLSKGADLHKMREAIHTVMGNQIYVDPNVAQMLALKNLDSAELSPLESLSKRELEIVLSITQGLELTTIAEKLCLSPQTVSSYRYHIQKKLKVQNDVQLTRLLKKEGFLEFN